MHFMSYLRQHAGLNLKRLRGLVLLDNRNTILHPDRIARGFIRRCKPFKKRKKKKTECFSRVGKPCIYIKWIIKCKTSCTNSKANKFWRTQIKQNTNSWPYSRGRNLNAPFSSAAIPEIKRKETLTLVKWNRCNALPSNVWWSVWLSYQRWAAKTLVDWVTIKSIKYVHIVLCI